MAKNKIERKLICECGYVVNNKKEYFNHLEKCGLKLNRKLKDKEEKNKMRITIESLDNKRKAIIETHEYIDIYEIAEELRGLLIAWGYHSNTVKEILPEE